VGREHLLDRQGKERAQALGDLLTRYVLGQPSGVDLEAVPEVDERVAGEDGPAVLDPEHEVVVLLSGECHDSGQPVACRKEVSLAGFARQQPGHVGAAPGCLFRSEAELPHEVLLGVGRRYEHRYAEPLHQAAGVSLVPRRRQHDRRLAPRRKLDDLARRGYRIEQQQTAAVVDRVGGNRLAPPHAPFPLRVRCLPVPQARRQLTHDAMLRDACVLPCRTADSGTSVDGDAGEVACCR
jgi:hypothetical protein